MPRHELLALLLKMIWVLFAFAYGACLGSLTNVIAYRVPKGLSIVRPPSKCPKCQTKLSWRDNIPVLGWIALRGKCRYCRVKISPEYPIVEAAVGLLFALFLVVWYVLPAGDLIRPRWAALNPAEQTWPEFVVLLFLLASLFASTLVDAKTFTIPIWLTWFPAILAVIVYPVHAAWLSRTGTFPPRAQVGWTWYSPSPGPDGWNWVWLSIGGVVGLGLGLLLLGLGLIGRSFSDYAEWEAKAKAEHAAANPPASPESLTAAPPTTPLEPAVVVTDAQSTPTPPEGDNPDASPHLWMHYPHARREMIRELAFLAPCTLLMLAGWHWGGSWGLGAVPLWLDALSAVLLGYLIGGGVVWAVRIFGSLAFGKEAMGMGDVHLMAGVGACLGWIDATLGFFGAAFVGLGWAVLGRLAGGGFTRMLPYGPFLAVSTVLVLLCKPLIQQGLTVLLGRPVFLPP